MFQDNSNQSKTLYLFIDESGNFDFSSKGTKYFLLSSIATFRPSLNKEKILDYKYDLLKNGNNKEYFHATEDEQIVRDNLFSFIEEMGEYLDVYSVIVQKNKVNPALFREVYRKKGKTITRNTGIKLYEKTCQSLLKYIFLKHERKDVEKIIVVLGSIFPNDKRGAMLKTLKVYFKNTFQKPFEIYFHDSKSDLNCQIADYCCWAVSVKWERKETRPYDLLNCRDIIKSEFDMFEKGETIHYSYE